MSRCLLTDADQKECLSLVYAKAVAAMAGFDTSEPDTDRDSVDLRIQAGGFRRPALDLQLKSTARSLVPKDGCVAFRLSRKNYDDLRAQTQTPRVLVVLELPPEESQWVTVTEEELILRRRAYWMTLQSEHYEEKDQGTITIHIPVSTLFHIEALRTLIEASSRGQL